MTDRPLLVLGASGFLGRALARALHKAQTPWIAGLSPNSQDNGRPAPTAPLGAKIVDMGDAGALERALDEIQPATVINLAGRVDLHETDVAALLPINGFGAGLLALWAKANGARLVHASTIAVHGPNAPLIGADTPLAPAGAYAISKARGEELVQWAGADALIVRIGGLVGLDGPDHPAINRALRAAKDGAPPTLMGAGTAKRAWLHVDAAARALLEASESAATGLARLAGETVPIASALADVADVWTPGQPLRKVEAPAIADQAVTVSPLFGAPAPLRPWLEAERDRVRAARAA